MNAHDRELLDEGVCPHCGGDAHYDLRRDRWTICDACDARIAREESIRMGMWVPNRREERALDRQWRQDMMEGNAR